MDAVRASDTAIVAVARQMKRTVYEFIKVNDILINIIKAKNPKSQDTKYLEGTYASMLKELDEKLEAGTSEESIDGDIKNLTKSFNNIVKTFSTKVFPMIERNDATAASKALRKLPDNIVSTYTAINKYAANTAAEVKAAGSLITKNSKPSTVNESYYYNDVFGSLLYEGTSKMGKFGEGLKEGAIGTGKALINAVSLNGAELEKNYDGLNTTLSNLGRDFSKIGKSQSNDEMWSNTKNFFTSPDLAKVIGGVAVLAGTLILVKKAYKGLKKMLSVNKNQRYEEQY